MAPTRPHTPHRPALAAALLTALALASCGQARLTSLMRGQSLKVTSDLRAVELAPAWRTSVFVDRDAQSADLYLSDLPIERLADLTDPLTDAPGTIVHVAIFLEPKAGATPIDASACNAAVRQLILAGPARGLYGGGGFVVPGGLGNDTITASVRNATLRLTRASEGFQDLLGPCTIGGVVRARRDPAAARVIAQRMQNLAGPLPPVAPAR